jgi:hypothetical protein
VAAAMPIASTRLARSRRPARSQSLVGDAFILVPFWGRASLGRAGFWD